MIEFNKFDRRPIIVAIAGPNGAGKSTFHDIFLASSGLRFVNADVLAAEFEIASDEAARIVNAIRRELVELGESFIFETVFSDPVGDKIAFLESAVQLGYEVVLCYIGLSSSEQSLERVAMRVSQGGHDVPDDKIHARYSRTLHNLREAISRLPNVWVYDNSDLSSPFRVAAIFEHGQARRLENPIPKWLQAIVGEGH